MKIKNKFSVWCWSMVAVVWIFITALQLLHGDTGAFTTLLATFTIILLVASIWYYEVRGR